MTSEGLIAKKALILAAVVANPDRRAGNIAKEFGVSTRTVLKVMVDHWRGLAIEYKRQLGL